MLPKSTVGALCVALIFSLAARPQAAAQPATPYASSDAREVSAWFLGEDREIRWCLQPRPGVLALTEQWFFRGAIERSIASWVKYIAEKKVNRSNPGEPPLTTKWKYVGACNESNGSADIAFYFGNGHREPERFRSEFKSPAAFAIRTSYDQSTGWGKGFIWLSDELSTTFNAERIFPLITHEIGHVYGCEHIEGTIMDADIVQLVSSPNQFNIVNIGTVKHVAEVSIDADRELYACHDCPFSIVDSDFGKRNDLSVLFYRLTSQQSHGPVKISLDGWIRHGVFTMSLGLWTDHERELLPLELGGDEDSIRRHLHNSMEIRLHKPPRFIKVSEMKAFKKLYRGQKFHRSPQAWTAAGSLYSRSLHHWPVVINRGLGGAFDIAVYDDHGPIFIYRLPATKRSMIVFSAM